MQKKLLIFLIFLTSLYAYNYSLKDGWQMVGAVENIEDMGNFDNSCVKSVWRYDDVNLSWQTYISNTKEKNTLNSLDIAMGFWVQADGSCKLNPPSNIAFTKLYDGDKYIIGDTNQSKRFQIVIPIEFNKFYLNYVDNNPTPDIDFENNGILFLRDISQDLYTHDIRVKEIKGYSNYKEVFIETTIIKSVNKKIDGLSAPFEFISIPKGFRNIIFNETIIVENRDVNGDLIDSDINDTFLELSFREVDLQKSDSKYGQLGNIPKRLEVVQTLEVFKELYENHINPVGIFKELPFINFEKETLLTLFMGGYGSGGYAIRVTSVKEYDNYVEVKIENSMPGDYCIVTDSLTAPTTFVTIPKTNKEIVFKEYANVKICEEYL